MFTMIIFIMMLTSTCLMYYYFQRARSLEQQLSTLRGPAALPSTKTSGTIKVGESRYRLASWEQQDKAAAAAPTPSPTPEAPVSDAQADPSAPLTAIEDAPVLTSTPQPDQHPPALQHARETKTETDEATEQPATASHRQQEVAPAASATPARTPQATPVGPIQSVYDLQSAPTEEPRVRVRAPQRNP